MFHFAKILAFFTPFTVQAEVMAVTELQGAKFIHWQSPSTPGTQCVFVESNIAQDNLFSIKI